MVLFFSDRLCVFGLSPFTKKRRPQPFLREVRFSRGPEGRAGALADAVRATERSAEQKKPDLKTKLPTQKNQLLKISNEVS